MCYSAARRATRGRPDGGYQYKEPTDLVHLNNFYITCQVDEDLPYIMQYTGDDRLMLGSDYTHADPAMQLDFVEALQDRANQGDIPKESVQKIIHDNAKEFYGL